MAQKWLLNVCGFIDFLNPPRFAYLVKVNASVTKFANKRIELERFIKSCLAKVYVILFPHF